MKSGSHQLDARRNASPPRGQDVSFREPILEVLPRGQVTWRFSDELLDLPLEIPILDCLWRIIHILAIDRLAGSAVTQIGQATFRRKSEWARSSGTG